MGESRSNLGDTDDGAVKRSASVPRTFESGRSADSEPGDILARGTVVGRYVVLERLGAGAMGVVYAAYDPELDRKVALKFLLSRDVDGANSRRQVRLQREAQAIAKLSHPNVVSIYDVGVHDGQVFLAMEYLPGGTLTRWLAEKKRPWPEILAAFVQIGHGLSAAHAEDLVHRDFKPENVLLDKDGKPKVVDFGLVRLSSVLDESTSAEGVPKVVAPATGGSTPSIAALAADLTRTGAMTGTPAYMAPEQFLGEPVSASSDQFAYCVSLYRALYGAPPFPGASILTLATSVVEGRLSSPVPGANVPPWIRRLLERGLAVKPQSRFATMAELVRQLDRKPLTWKRIGVVGGPTLVIAAVVVVATAVVGGRMRARAELEVTIARSREETRRHDEAATKHRAEAERFHATAIHFFDEGSGLLPGGAKAESWSRGEADWARALEEEAAAQAEYAKASTALEAALLVDPARSEIRQNLVSAIESRLTLAEDFFQRDMANELAGRVKGLNDAIGGSSASSSDDAKLTLLSRPRDMPISIARYVPEPTTGRLRLDSPRVLRADETTIAAGSYLLTWSRDGTHTVRLPVLLRRGRKMSIQVQEPRWSSVPDGFVFVGAGESLSGSDEENLRSALDVPPMHLLRVRSFLIGRFEVTFTEYIRWLDTLPPGERSAHLPKNRAYPGELELKDSTANGWTLILQPVEHYKYVARWGESIRYAGRTKHAAQDWRRFPVTAVSFEDAQAYAHWLDRTGRVPGARVCRDEEWERAARGADGRIYANGWRILPSETNMDMTYGGRDDSFGPDEVGSHPESASPFGVEDMEGNAFEMVATSRWGESTAQHGGSWYADRIMQRAENRFRSTPNMRHITLGFRLCAPAPID